MSHKVSLQMALVTLTSSMLHVDLAKAFASKVKPSKGIPLIMEYY